MDFVNEEKREEKKNEIGRRTKEEKINMGNVLVKIHFALTRSLLDGIINVFSNISF